MPHRILIVEDNEDTRSILTAVLGYRGYEPHTTQTAEEMFERLDQIQPDLIVLDVRLPGMNGCEALVRLREQGFSKPIFLFSEYYDLFLENIKTCRPDGFFPKSKGPMPLVHGIEQLLDTGTAA